MSEETSQGEPRYQDMATNVPPDSDQAWDEANETDEMDEMDERPDQHYGLHDRYGREGTLAEGYGQSEEMGEDEWSAERYEREARDVDEPILDRGEARDSAGMSDIDRMIGGMIGADEPEDENE